MKKNIRKYIKKMPYYAKIAKNSVESKNINLLQKNIN